MVDYQSKYRMYSHGYTAINPRAATPLRELYHENGRKLFSARKDRPVHDCRAEVVKNHTAPEDWDAWLLSHGLRSTYTDCLGSHQKKRDLETPPEKKALSKLLFQLGAKGSGEADFNYPRGLCANQAGDVFVADSGNHRIQVFNRCGVFKLAFGKQGSEKGEFQEPTDVVELPDGKIAVADRRNRRIQVFSEKGIYLHHFSTVDHPYSLACDRHSNLVVGTLARTVELYRDLLPVGCFTVPFNRGNKDPNCPLHVGITDQQEVVVSDPPDQCVKIFDMAGILLRQFRPQSHADGLTCSPGGMFISAVDKIMVADTLNHSVSLFTSTGTFLQKVLLPTDDVGCLHSLTISPEGHLLISEFSMTGEHGVKMFWYRDCPCHKGRLPKTKKRTLTKLV